MGDQIIDQINSDGAGQTEAAIVTGAEVPSAPSPSTVNKTEDIDKKDEELKKKTQE